MSEDNVDVVFLFRGAREELARQVEQGTAPDEFLYGLPSFRSAGWKCGVCEARPGRYWFKPFLEPLESLVTKLMGLGFPLTFALADFRMLRKARLLVATTDGTGLCPLLFKRMGLLKSRVIVLSQGLYRIAAMLKGRPFGAARLRILSWLYRKAEPVIVFGEGDARAYEGVFARFGSHAVCREVHFGIDETFWKPCEGGLSNEMELQNDVLSVGSDVLRDYETLLRAVGDKRCRIVTRLKVNPELIPPRTTVDGDVSWLELRGLYRNSKLVVVPTKNQPRDSGHSATLQALACGKAVILSETPGLWDREGLVHGRNIWLVPPEDPQALAKAMEQLLSDDELRIGIANNAREYVLKGHTSKRFGSQLISIASE